MCTRVADLTDAAFFTFAMYMLVHPTSHLKILQQKKARMTLRRRPLNGGALRLQDLRERMQRIPGRLPANRCDPRSMSLAIQ